jgi:hypothetical protein
MTIKSTFEYNADDPLALMNGENEKANKALNDYALMGVARSWRKLIDRYQQDSTALAAYKANPAGWDKNTPIPLQPPSMRQNTFAVWSKKYAWEERVQLFDALQRADERKEYEADRLEWKKRRLDLLKAAFFKLAQMLSKLDANATETSIGELTRSIKDINEQMRLELGENVPAVLMNFDFDDPNIPLEVLEKIVQGDASAVPELLASRNKGA